MTEVIKIKVSLPDPSWPLEVTEVSQDGKSALSLWKQTAGEEIEYEISFLSRLEIAPWPEEEDV